MAMKVPITVEIRSALITDEGVTALGVSKGTRKTQSQDLTTLSRESREKANLK